MAGPRDAPQRRNLRERAASANTLAMPAFESAIAYAERVRAIAAQRERLQRTALSPERWDRHSPSYRFDPHREPDGNFSILSGYFEPDDDVVEVGGGAGRIGLPLALQCRSLTNVEPSGGMGEQFLACARDAGIANAKLVQSRWPAPTHIEGDVALTVDVTYFISDIVPFIDALHASARRRAIVMIWSVPPPSWNAALFRVVFQEDQVPAPGLRELLPVLWDMGILPDVRVLPEGFSWPEKEPRTRDDAAEFAVDQLDPLDREEAKRRVEAGFESLFRRDGGIYRPAWRPFSPGLIITWPTGGAVRTAP